MRFVMAVLLCMVRRRPALSLVLHHPRVASRHFASRLPDAEELAAHRAAEVAIAGDDAPARKVPLRTKKMVAARQNYRCICGVQLPFDHEIDHIVPVALNGSNAMTNLQALCKKCHAQKTRDQRHAILEAKRKPKVKKEVPLQEAPRRKFNAGQAQAVKTEARAVRVVAGPGTGKTRVLIDRVADLIHTRAVPPWSILAVTFTNKAANELRTRLREGTLGETAERISVGTFHRICLYILRRDVGMLDDSLIKPGFAVYDQTAMIALTKFCIKDILKLDKSEFPYARVQSLISAAKNAKAEQLSDFLVAEEDLKLAPTLDRIFVEYQNELGRRNAIDFDDMLLLTARLLTENQQVRDKYRRRWRHVLVDEFQDTNTLQYEVMKGLAGGSVFVVGDADQAIYGWRGADYENLRKFDEEFAPTEKIALNLNYRSSQKILDAARHVVNESPRPRDDVHLEAAADGDSVVALVAVEDQDAEARFVADVVHRVQKKKLSIGILYRTNAQSSNLERELLARGVKYTLAAGRTFFQRKEVLDAMAFLRLLQSPSDDLALERVVNVPPRGFGAKSLQSLRTTALEMGLPLSDAIDSSSLRPRAKNILTDFLSMIDGLRTEFHETSSTTSSDDDQGVVFPTRPQSEEEEAQKGPVPGSVAWLLVEILGRSGYARYVRDEMDNGDDRRRNLRELVNLATPFGSDLPGFLDDCALLQDADGRAEDRRNSHPVHLATVHSAKGLEFDLCFVVGCEDHLFPHWHAAQKDDSTDEHPDIDEERRLLYVAMTRAKRFLYLLHARRRLTWGIYRDADLSPFLGTLASSADVAVVQGGGSSSSGKTNTRHRPGAALTNRPLRMPVSDDLSPSDNIVGHFGDAW